VKPLFILSDTQNVPVLRAKQIEMMFWTKM